MGEGFSTGPDDLRKASKEHMGAMIQDLEKAIQQIAKTSEKMDAFTGGGEIFMDAHEYYQDAKEYLLRVLMDNIQNIDLDIRALHEIADRYESVDQASAEGLTR
ncbi:hypothetical protein [Saccharopolyspora taberi]|uniref:WXG100 family type VII secretion target n=1 Tax=Saccharopolyspora taberi TaxID=60895 RepID=A0ABN3VLF4_9PSEU